MTRNRLIILLALLTFIVLAVVLHLHNVSTYLIYPDSYQNLVVAENIRHGYGLVGRLGENGMWYPDTFWWTRPAYAYLISVFSAGNDAVKIGSYIALTAGVLAVPAVYIMLTKLWGKRQVALIGAGLIAISYALTVWGGFVQTESLGVLSMTIFLASLFAVSRRKDADIWAYLVVGAALGLAIVTRYEYAVMVLPMAYWIYATDRRDWWLRFGAALAGAFLVVSAVLFALGPVPFGMGNLVDSTRSFLLPLIIVTSLIVLATAVLIKWQIARRWTLISLPYLLSIMAAVSLLVGGISSFVSTDFLICTLALYGMTVMLQNRQYRNAGIFTLFSVLLLSAVYYQVNPDMQRYWTHTMPLLVIAAAFGAHRLAVKVSTSRVSSYRAVLISIAAIAVAAQIVTSWQGLHNYKDGLWFRSGYEEVAAKQVKTLVPKDATIIASTPEPYYLFTDRSTQSIAPDAPFIYMPPGLDDKKVVVINDESMRYYFPKFSAFLESSLQRYKTHQFLTGESFREQNNVTTEKKPVEVYVLSLRILNESIDHASRP